MENINWSDLTFGYIKTDYNVRSYYSDGKWSDPEISDSEYINIHIASTCLHYGQEAFEGLKAFRGKDGKIRIFRLYDNALRMQASARGIMMPELPVELFEKAVKEVVEKNKRFIPPYESGASLYLRPLQIGISPQVGVKPAKEYLFAVFATPVGPYFKGGLKPSPYVILRGFDRAAPCGTGTIKVGGNYAAGLSAGEIAHSKGYSAVLYLDAKEKKYIDECGPANFFGIKNNTYITPDSHSILPSITNKSLIVLAEELGLKVERRPVKVEELETLEEAGACGTAAVISPISRIDDVDENKSYIFSKDGYPGPVCIKLYNKLRAIQYGDEEDKYGWITVL
ncbi:MAG: branched-chain amino acid aminotransferase [Dysgonamonadaceae bacterium]|jgi:branched-chain amino acid aminotransferase|nr:branched-chain amino acid aminotransferase [Dysgonamonadaceae bacterium]